MFVGSSKLMVCPLDETVSVSALARRGFLLNIHVQQHEIFPISSYIKPVCLQPTNLGYHLSKKVSAPTDVVNLWKRFTAAIFSYIWGAVIHLSRSQKFYGEIHWEQ